MISVLFMLCKSSVSCAEKFHAFTTHHYVDGGSRHFKMHITVVEFHGDKKFHPMPMAVYSNINNKNNKCPNCLWVVIQVSGRLARADMNAAPA